MRLTPFLPDSLKRGLNDYLNHGSDPGAFLQAVLTNDLKRACETASTDNLKALPQIVSYFYNNIPSMAWGSYERVQDWMVERQLIAAQMEIASRSQPRSKAQAAA